MIARVVRANVYSRLTPSLGLAWDTLQALLLNQQNRRRAFHVGRVHYDLGNTLYQAMLDKRLTYTCGYWKDASDLDAAQEAKLDLACRKMGLTRGQRVLDIGCGWGSFAKFAAERYGVRVVGVTISREQAKLAEELCRGLPVEIRLQDFRDVRDTFDHIVSFGMFEHVGYKNYRTYFEVARRCLKDSGLMLLHTIGGNTSVRSVDPWIAKHIFPGSLLPSAKQLSQAAEGLFVMEDWHNFSADYDKTLMAWHANFEAHWNDLAHEYDERFHRMWRFYLLSCAGTFRSRMNQLWQIVYSTAGVPGGYRSIR
jgi:cyclopropane-fatty-acyl-phospholipid synthase